MTDDQITHLILPDASEVPTLWRFTGLHDAYPVAVAQERDLDPHVWAALLQLYGQPRQAGAPVHLLEGPQPLTANGDELGGRLLITVWPDGSGTAAWRSSDDTREAWGPPTVLDPAP